MQYTIYEIQNLIDDLDATASEKHLLTRLAFFANKDGTSIFPAKGNLASKLSRTRRSVISATNILVDRAILEVVVPPKGRRPTEYRINIPLLKKLSEESKSGIKASPPSKRPSRCETRSHITRNKEDTPSSNGEDLSAKPLHTLPMQDVKKTPSRCEINVSNVPLSVKSMHEDVKPHHPTYYLPTNRPTNYLAQTPVDNFSHLGEEKKELVELVELVEKKELVGEEMVGIWNKHNQLKAYHSSTLDKALSDALKSSCRGRIDLWEQHCKEMSKVSFPMKNGERFLPTLMWALKEARINNSVNRVQEENASQEAKSEKDKIDIINKELAIIEATITLRQNEEHEKVNEAKRAMPEEEKNALEQEFKKQFDLENVGKVVDRWTDMLFRTGLDGAIEKHIRKNLGYGDRLSIPADLAEKKDSLEREKKSIFEQILSRKDGKVISNPPSPMKRQGTTNGFARLDVTPVVLIGGTTVANDMALQ